MIAVDLIPSLTPLHERFIKWAVTVLLSDTLANGSQSGQMNCWSCRAWLGHALSETNPHKDFTAASIWRPQRRASPIIHFNRRLQSTEICLFTAFINLKTLSIRRHIIISGEHKTHHWYSLPTLMALRNYWF